MRSAFAALLMAVLTPFAHAGLVGFTFNAGPVTFVENGPVDPEIATFQGFQLGESVLISFTIDDTTADLDAATQRGEFEDPNGYITLIGGTSGTTIEMRQGVNIQLDSVFEFDLRNIAVGPELHVFELFGDTDYLTSVPILSDPDNLATSIAELASLLDADGHFIIPNLSISSTGAVGTEDSIGPFIALEFGPVASVPTPSAFLLLFLGLAVLMRNRTLGVKPD